MDLDAERLRAHLIALARRGGTTTYGDLAKDIELRPPGTIQRVAAALEAMIAEDAAAGVPPLAALVLAKRGGGLPAPGFFDCARRRLGYAGPPRGPEARAFHAAMLRAALDHWGKRRD